MDDTVVREQFIEAMKSVFPHGIAPERYGDLFLATRIMNIHTNGLLKKDHKPNGG